VENLKTFPWALFSDIKLSIFFKAMSISRDNLTVPVREKRYVVLKASDTRHKRELRVKKDRKCRKKVGIKREK
jgi:hypothetical protein